jgi:hypothetical protein
MTNLSSIISKLPANVDPFSLFGEKSIERSVLSYHRENLQKEGVKFEILVPIADVRKTVSFIINKTIA